MVQSTSILYGCTFLFFFVDPWQRHIVDPWQRHMDEKKKKRPHKCLVSQKMIKLVEGIGNI